jgi:PAS domain-containing protein
MWIVVSTTVGLAACCLAVAAWKWRRERSLTLRLHAVEAARSGLAGAQEHYKQLAESRDSIFQSAPLCMIAMDSDGTITAMNLAAEKLTGYTREELVGTASITILHDEKELDSRAAELAASGTAADGDARFAVLTANASRGEIEEREWNYVRRDGSRIPVSVAMRAVTSEAGAVSGYVGVATDISERKQMLARMTHLATHDHLTKLAGRALLQENLAQAVERARRYGTRVAVFLVDLDQLKRVNDSLGHTNGDKVLVEIAGRLRRAVRSSDTVARVGATSL